MQCFLPLLKRVVPFLFFAISFSTAQAQDWKQIIKMNGNDRTNKKTSGRSVDDEFGSAVAISGNYAVVGARYDDEDSLGLNPMMNSGAAFIFQKVEGKWQKVRKINASRRTSEAYFGCAVAIYGNYIVVGAHRDTENQFNSAGAAYIFEKDEGGTGNWGEVKRIVAPVRTEYGDAFGFSVGISNDYVIVGAPGEDQDAHESNTINDSGSAFIYKRDNGGANNWGIVKKITAPVRDAGDSFGYSVSISNDYAVVGANWEGEDANEGNTMPGSGSVYLFNKFVGGENNWGLFKKLTATARSEHAYFGCSVSIEGNFVVVGASGANGSAYVFEKDWGAFNNWGQVKKLVAPVEEAGAEFGFAVAIDGHRAIVGSRSRDYRVNNPDAGAAYVFKKDQGDSNNWGLLREVNASGSSSGDYFGTSVAISGESALVGAVGESGDDHENLTVKSAGAAYFFTGDYSGPDSWNLLQKVTASTGAKPSAFSGMLSISGDYAIMGAPLESGDADGQNPIIFAGAAYIMYNNAGNWVQVKKIVAPDRHERDAFGYSVAISGEYVVVSAMWQVSGTGAAYIFKRDLGGANNWGFLKKITSSVPTVDDWFGISVGISGDNVIVGAFGEDEDESEGNKLNASGAAYIFNKDQGGSDNWGLVKKVTIEKRLADVQLGSAVSISGDYAIAGAIGDDYDESDANFIDNSGAAYIFKKDQGGINNWGQVKKLVASERTSGSQFGIGLAISGENVIVGAPAGYIWDASAVYIYSKNSGGTDHWGIQKSLRGAEKTAGAKVQTSTIEKFGRTVGISDDYAVMGTSRLGLDSLGRAVDYGYDAAYVFGKNKGGTNNWGLSQTLISKDSVRGDAFASSVAISAKYIVTTAPGDDEDTNGDNTISNSGSVYFFINAATPLPVTLISFDAGKVENQILLKWITNFESNSDYFEIQKSADARNWEVIGNLSAAQESSSQQNYAFTDARPFAGENLYRLKMVDRDGTFAFSRIRSLSNDGKNGVVLYPNPVSERLYIRSDAGKVESVKMTNALGQMVLEFNNIPADGISLEHLATGVYVIQVKKVDGGRTSQKVVIAR
ncbi:T9SS type A sorting domain-containing protein [Dyadobacter sp. LHD-138]|uniref:T9SS type A sorting domain-containing protein n=1 Tax=Dyadobacter sp. LHD-138 TaxID=3071413 RepID=UPI0027E09BD3|nr:T9SS type A sorting domain-containing protein [Dyadobacter sp. LHD-138]MDQ6479265.1 T9SS type A sorting domain-containing protein [Dyadobacter sp. LHD-138]